MERNIGKALGRGKGGPRVDNFERVARDICDRCEGLADVNCPNDDNARRRDVDVEKELDAFKCRQGGFAGEKDFGDCSPKFACDDIALAHHTVTALGEFAHQHRRNTVPPGGVELFEIDRLHQPSRSR
jgi:hypothetical protein